MVGYVMSRIEFTADALFLYTKNGFADIVQKFLTQAPELFRAKGPKNFNIAHYAVHSGLPEFFDIPQIAAYADTPADDGYLPIMEAVKYGCHNMAIKLVDLKNDNNYSQIKTTAGATLLHLVAMSWLDSWQARELVLRLFTEGLRLADIDKENKTPLDYARELNRSPEFAVAKLKELWEFYDQSIGSSPADSQVSDEAINRSHLSLNRRPHSCPALFVGTSDESSETVSSADFFAYTN